MKSLPAPRGRGTPGAAAASVSRPRAEESPCLPPSLKPGKGRWIPEGQKGLNAQDKLTYTDIHRHTLTNGRPLQRSLTFPSLKRGPERGQHGRAAKGRARCPRHPAQRARRRRSPGRPRGRRKPGPRVGTPAAQPPAPTRPSSEGHDGCAPRAHVSQHRLIAADLPGLRGFRTSRLCLSFLPAAPGAFP